ncbi:hydrolase 1, exosortase A system-associated [Altererythrobacter salegens]|uniref:Hydrolase 1, exosortase A system-associated n=1 Tax=Croceibacterium salegens TaxID=1737568 RepID=A0A6I4SWU8_9SPHN|nr:hydrolase 1, exosortase A system-associated [Croceibacterium salegens]MXO59517.1 hydrolase 1, exosortase A system-associated [Croceibacterium salegens]
MNRKHIAFDCGGAQLAGTLDDAEGTTGLLLVTGGNETRAGAFSGQAALADRIARAGHPVFRFDRRGVGDSEGYNMGFRHSQEDIAAALKAFRDACPGLSRVVALGNCDAASALMLAGGAGADALVLSNPWTYEDGDADAAPPPEAIRARYAQKLKDPRELWRLLTGGVNLRKLAGGLRKAASAAPPPSDLAGAMAQGLEGYRGPVKILIAGADRTGQAFLSGWDRGDKRLAICEGADHAYSGATGQEWLLQRILAVLADK